MISFCNNNNNNNYMWGDYENETLIHYHSMAKENKKKYHRAGSFHNSLYSLFGLLSILASTVASTISWSSESEDNKQPLVLSTITTISAITSAIQNFYKFQENSTNFIDTSKSYARIQNKIEGVGNIHPEYRTVKPEVFLKKIQDKVDLLSDSRIELSSIAISCIYSNKSDKKSYLLEKHEKFKHLNDTQKLNFTKNSEVSMDGFSASDNESDIEIS